MGHVWLVGHKSVKLIQWCGWKLIPASSISLGPHVENYNLDYRRGKLLYYSIKSRSNQKQNPSLRGYPLILSALCAYSQRTTWLIPYLPQGLALSLLCIEALTLKLILSLPPLPPPHHSLNCFVFLIAQTLAFI